MNAQQNAVSVVCLTGHRNIPFDHMERLPSLIEAHLRELIARGAREVRAGGALGFDTVAALKVLELKGEFPDLKLTLCLPCRDQTRDWKESWCRAYTYVLERADSVHYETDTYTRSCMLDRNRRLVEGSDVCLTYCTHRRGGTYYTCSYARERGVEVINLAKELTEAQK